MNRPAIFITDQSDASASFNFTVMDFKDLHRFATDWSNILSLHTPPAHVIFALMMK